MLFILLSVFILSIISVHGTEDLANDCIEALNAGSITGMCVKAAQLKWNLDSLNSATATQASCCAMYEALNCLQKSSCNVCPQKDLHGKMIFSLQLVCNHFLFVCHLQTLPNIEYEHCLLWVRHSVETHPTMLQLNDAKWVLQK